VVWRRNCLFYADYGTPSTLRFKGIVEKVGYKDEEITLSGRSFGFLLLTRTITKSYTNTETSVILKDILASDATEFNNDLSYINESSKSITVNWSEKPILDCIKELCNAANFDFYIDVNNAVHYFEKRSIINQEEAIVHGINLESVGNFGPDITSVINKVRVYGQSLIGTPIVATSSDDESINEYYLRMQVINDTNVASYAQAIQRTEYELEQNKNAPIVGEISTLPAMGLPSIQPGEMLSISAPDNGIEPGLYRVVSYTHDIGHEVVLKTKVKIEKLKFNIPVAFKNVIDTTQQLSNITNPYHLDYSFNMPFTDYSTTDYYNNVEITTVLRCMPGFTSGTWVSITRIASLNITKLHLIVTGENLSGTVYEFSVDNGNTWETITENTLYSYGTNFTGIGNQLKLRITLKSDTTNVKSACLLYS